ncbi:MAG TPA: hypothetical protein VGO62_07720, partial [Myxococcota bacterium]
RMPDGCTIDQRGLLRVPIGDDDDPSLPTPTGVDELTGENVSLGGHYGIHYELDVDNASPALLLLNPRAGAFAGAVRVDGATIGAPSVGTISSSSSAVFLGELAAGAHVIESMPPGGSSLPVDVLFAE